MQPVRRRRYNSTMRRNLAEIFLLDIENPLLRKLTIVDAVVSADFRSVDVIYDKPGDVEEETIGIHLRRTKGYVKQRIARRMALRYVPKLRFIFGRAAPKSHEKE